jgi:predicted transcriptional regulator
MPRIESVDFANGKFKKKKVRSWDDDLATSLLIMTGSQPVKEEKNSVQNQGDLKKIKEKNEPALNKTLDLGDKKIKISPIKEKLVYGKIENSVGFLDDSFRFRKIILRLAPSEKKVLMLVVNICSSKNSLKTGDIESEDFDGYLEFSRNSRETAIKRLCKKGVLKRGKGRRGASGELNLSISGLVFSLATEILF